MTLIEEPFEPSCRMKGMSWDFSYLIDDPITDLQLNPSSLMLLQKPVLYLGSSWTGLKPHTDFDFKYFHPSLFNKISVGLRYALDLYQQSGNHEDGIYVYQFRDFKQHFSFLTGIPFIKKNGILALKLSYIYYHENSTSIFQSKTDTFFIVDGDTTRSHYNNYTYSSSDYKTPQWWISLNQSLPLYKTSSIDFMIEFCPFNSSQIVDDTMISNECDSSISYRYPYKFISSHNDSLTTSDHYSTKKLTPTGILTCIYKFCPSWAQMRLLGRFGITRGRVDKQDEYIQNEIHISKTHVFEPDTDYYFGDSSTNWDTNYSADQMNRITYNSILGAGGRIPQDKGDILVGLKLGYYYTRESDGLTYYINQSFNASLSLGTEWSPVSFLCLRDGLNIYYYDDIFKDFFGDTLIINKFITYGGVGSIGFGIKVGNKLKFDYATDITLDSPLKYWSLDCIYEF